MSRKSVAKLLVLIIGLSPIASAFAACVGAEYTEMGGMTFDSSGMGAYAVGVMRHSDRKNDRNVSPMDMNCHSNGGCVFHWCGVLGLTDANQFAATFYTNPQVILSVSNVKDRVLPPELRPPIIIL